MPVRRYLSLALAATILCVAAGPERTWAVSRLPPTKPDAIQTASSVNPIGYNQTISNENSLVEVNPSVAYNSSRAEYLAVWYNDRPGNDDIRAQRLSKDGRLLGGPFYISAAGEGIDRRYPRIAYNVRADQYLVVWEHQETSAGYSIHGRRVSGTGQILDANDIIIRSAGANLYTPARPAVAYTYTSDRYLVVWEETWHPIPISTGIYGQQVLDTGELEDIILTISEDPGGHFRTVPDLAYNLGRNEYLVAWQQLDPGASLTDIYVRRVTGDGDLLNPSSIQLTFYTVSTTSPAVAALPISPDGVFLVVFELHYSTTDWDIIGRPVLSDGTPQTVFTVTGTFADEKKPAVAGSLDRGQFLVTWQELPNPSFLFTVITGRLATPSGTVVDSPIPLGGLFADNPRLAAGAHGDFLAVFDDVPLTVDSGIYGQLVGNRVYIPILWK
jgi:hypothetical protein